MGRKLLILLVLFALPASAGELTLGIYVPRLAFADAVERARWADEVAVRVSQATGRSFTARAFSRQEDLVAFVRSGRLTAGLVDPTAALQSGEVVAAGTGPEGRSPAYAALAPAEHRGLRRFEGGRLALPLAGPRELNLLSNLALESEVDLKKWFARVQWADGVVEVGAWLRSGRADVTLGYRSVGVARGLKVAADLMGVPLPVFVSYTADAELKAALRLAVARGLALPPRGPLTRLVSADASALIAVAAATGLNAGQRAARSPVWAPVAEPKTLSQGAWPVKPRGDIPLPRPVDRWRVPDFPEI